VDYNKYDVPFLFGQERTPENDYIFSALISFQKSVAQTIVYEHHRATFERQKRKLEKTEALKQKKCFRKKIKLPVPSSKLSNKPYSSPRKIKDEVLLKDLDGVIGTTNPIL
jgi:hypothetical protein